MEIVLDVDQLTIGDVEDIEEICGKSFEELNFDKPSARLLKAIVYVNGRKTNPNFTLEDARQVHLNEVTVKGQEPDPTEGGGVS